eukprot:CAMPEP_0204825048 /NCGR_PEP_ID=MMETSP1346-20131115/3021_1 /ASSEMBLY_ACC=CAM_ASM_000771 /TAXON_ID=215587 /ORGANISM="Aplanochytrium stocchinoi, Strain GSBS06" /LENGTH=668 /DNA_ID=CAMNT_0051952541 /DNA_START=1 /DNA_END=2007 /DNA_ORIENTATION=+
MLYSLLSAAKGIGSLTNDQLVQCHERLIKAERLASSGEDWVGKHGIRGLCLISMGLVELLQHSYVRGIYNIMRSWKYIRILRDEGLNYEGKEREIIRSAALLAIGMFYLLYSFLPPTTSKFASWLSGFEGDREKGLEYMYTCWKEGGICAPWGALNYISFHIDTKTFIGERMTDEEHATVVKMISMYNTKYPGSVLFAISESGLYATDRNIEKARELNELAEPELNKLPVLKWVMCYKRGVFYWTDCDWFDAGVAFEESMNIYIEAKRRSMVPFMAAYSFLSFLEAMKSQPEHADAAKEKCKALVRIANSYSSMHKKDWGRQDIFGFKIFNRYSEKISSIDSEVSFSQRKSTRLPGTSLLKLGRGKKAKGGTGANTPWVLLHLLECMVLQVRCTWFMTPVALEALRKKVLDEMQERQQQGMLTKGDSLRAEMCFVEMYTQMDKVSDALATANKALQMESDLTNTEKSFGAIPMILYYIAKIQQERGNLVEAKETLKKLKKYGTKYELADLIYLKLIVLSQQIGFDFERDYEHINVAAGYKKVVIIAVEKGSNTEDDTGTETTESSADVGDDNEKGNSPAVIEWAWFVEKHTVGFRAEFHPSDTSKSTVIIQTTSKAETEGKFHIGEFRPEAETRGKIHLVWDNTFSRLRSKDIQYRVSPAHLKTEVLT